MRGGRLRQGGGRDLHDLGLHRRQGRRTRPTSRSQAGGTGHTEAVEIVYDPAKVSYEQAARRVLAQHRSAREGPAVLRLAATSIAPAIFYHDDEQRKLAEETKKTGRRRNSRRAWSRPRSSRPSDVLQGRGLSPGLLQEESECAINSTASIAAAISASKSSGARRSIVVMTKRSHGLLGAAGTVAAFAALRWGSTTDAAPATKFEIEKSDDEWRQPADAGAIRRAAPARHRAPRHQPAQPGEAQGHVRLRRLRPAAVLVRDQIRKRHRLAELLPAAAECGRHHDRPARC